ncbi:hypothetical protein DSECCO2_575670 [anaerobic digester metagenome]
MFAKEDRFYADDKAVRGRAGILDRAKGHRLVCFFFPDPNDAEAAPKIARVCADALNAVVTGRQGGGACGRVTSSPAVATRV